MKVGKQITVSDLMNQGFLNWYTMRNAIAQQQALTNPNIRLLEPEKARGEYRNLVESLTHFANQLHPNHNKVFAALRNDVGDRGAMDTIAAIANNLAAKLRLISDAAMAKNATQDQASASAINAYIGNPGYDQFASLGFMVGQLFEQKTFLQSFMTEGDAYQLATEFAASASSISRFRVPVAQVSGSAKTRLGDLNPWTPDRPDSNNGVSVSVTNEFKDARSDYAKYFIDAAQTAQALGYARAASPALAGFVLQSLYVDAYLEMVAKNLEIAFVDGWQQSSYTPGVGGNYGLLSSAIMLKLASAGDASPLLATSTDWRSNPTKLVQQIVNAIYKPADITKPFPADADVTEIYQEVVRLLNMIAQTNVITGTKVKLYFPVAYYALAVKYLGVGTFNRQLDEAITKATSGIITKVEVVTSGLLGARINSNGVQQYNHVVAIVHGAPNDKKGVVMPVVTATPQISTGVISQQRIEYAAEQTSGGPMFLQTGTVFDLEFSVQHP